MNENLVRVYLEDAEIQRLVQGVDVFLINNNELPFSIPPDSKFNMETKTQERTNAEIEAELARNKRLIADGAER